MKKGGEEREVKKGGEEGGEGGWGERKVKKGGEERRVGRREYGEEGVCGGGR